MRVESPVQRTLRDAFTRSIVLALALIAGGFGAIGLGWKGVAGSLVVAEQLPYLLSGGVGGLALIATGSGILTVQATRYWNARERTRLDLVLARAAAVRPGGAAEPEPRSRA
ncbi:MAG: hypothetical protein ACRDKG_15345 [Actinomycetota bacterium]